MHNHAMKVGNGLSSPSFFWYHDTMIPSMVAWFRGVMVPWLHGIMVAWCRGIKVSWYHGVIKPTPCLEWRFLSVHFILENKVAVSWCRGVTVSWCRDTTLKNDKKKI